MNFYLIVIRSSDQKVIFNVQSDYQHCLQMFKRLEKEKGVEIKAYCLMPGYLKFIAGLKAHRPTAEISVFNQNSNHVIWKDFISSVKRQSKLQSQCVYISHRKRLEALSEYIECEPVRVGIVDDARHYKYSSAHSHDI